MRAFFSRTLKEKLQRHAMCNHLLIKDTIFAATSKSTVQFREKYILAFQKLIRPVFVPWREKSNVDTFPHTVMAESKWSHYKW